MSVATLYVGNLPWTTTEQDLVNLVGAHARVRSARIIMDRGSGRSRGFGFVEVEAEDAAAAVAALNGIQFGDRPLTVNEAQSKQR